NASCRPASCRDYPAHYGNSCRQTAQASIYPQFKAPDCITSHATYHFTGRYPYLLCFHVSKSCYPHPPPENPVIPDLYLAGIKLANLFRNYLEEEVRKCVLLFRYQGDTEKILVAMRLRGTPVPIPNTTVKTQAADGTA